MKTNQFTTLKHKKNRTVKARRLSSNEVASANKQFKAGMEEYFRESNNKIAMSKKKAKDTIVK